MQPRKSVPGLESWSSWRSVGRFGTMPRLEISDQAITSYRVPRCRDARIGDVLVSHFKMEYVSQLGHFHYSLRSSPALFVQRSICFWQSLAFSLNIFPF